jgi:hypothetical protein
MPERSRGFLGDKGLFRIMGECGEKLDPGPPCPESVGLSIDFKPFTLRGFTCE